MDINSTGNRQVQVVGGFGGMGAMVVIELSGSFGRTAGSGSRGMRVVLELDIVGRR